MDWKAFDEAFDKIAAVILVMAAMAASTICCVSAYLNFWGP